MVANEAPATATPVNSAHGRMAAWIHDHLGDHRESGLYYVYGALILVVPLWWRSRAARFSLIFVGVAWLMMALTKDAGQALHHEILLWPFPVLFAAVTLAAIPWRWLAVAIGAAMVLSNLLVVNQYVYQFEQYGSIGNFTDALFGLARALPEDRPIDAMDFGILVTMELAHQGHLQARFAGDPMRTESPTPAEQAQMRAMLAEPGALFVDHVPELEQFRGVGANLDRFATAEGYRKQPVQTVPDSHGRPVFEIFEYRRL
jgi:cell division protein FtsW (lipid II flippase)